MSEPVGRILQTKQLFKMLNIDADRHEEAEKIQALTIDFLLYMNVHDTFETSSSRFTKLNHDLLHIEYRADELAVVDSLARRKIIRIPC